MAENKREYIKFITPRSIARWPRLNKPDSGPKGKESKAPKYSVKVEFSPDDTCIVGKTKLSVADVRAKLEAARDVEFDAQVAKANETLKGKKLAEALKKLHKVDVFTDVLDAEGEETGMICITPKSASQYKDKKTGEMVEKPRPTVFDAKGQEIKKLPPIGGGSEMKVAVSASPYFVDSSGAVGITYYLDGVQMLKLVEFGSRSAESLGFGTEDGYDGSEESGAFEDESEKTGEAGDGDDF